MTDGGSIPATPTPEEVAWAAGLLEGEGYFCVRKDKQHRYVQLAMKSTDHDVILKLQSILGGTTHGPYKQPPNIGPRKDTFQWACSGIKDIVRVAALIHPHLCSRRSARLLEVLQQDTRGLPA